MARLTDSIKRKILADYHTNKYSQRELSKKYEVSVGTINNLTKDVTPENEHLVNAQISILTAKAYLSDEHLNAIMNTAKDEIYNKNLVINATQLNIVRMTEHLASNEKLEKINVGDGVQNFEKVGLGSSDYKNIQEGLDKASITLGVNQRHSNSQVSINNTNATQNNIEVDKELVYQVLQDFNEEY